MVLIVEMSDEDFKCWLNDVSLSLEFNAYYEMKMNLHLVLCFTVIACVENNY